MQLWHKGILALGTPLWPHVCRFFVLRTDSTLTTSLVSMLSFFLAVHSRLKAIFWLFLLILAKSRFPHRGVGAMQFLKYFHTVLWEHLLLCLCPVFFGVTSQ